MIVKNGKILSSNDKIVTSIDYDATLLINAIESEGGTLTLTEKLAWKNLINNGKTHDWIYHCIALYPLIGNTLASCKFNGLNPKNTDDAFRLTYTGIPNVSSNGLGFSGNSTTGACNTNLVPAEHGLGMSEGGGIFFYSRTNNAGGEYSAGSYHAGGGVCIVSNQGYAWAGAPYSDGQFANQNLQGLQYIVKEKLLKRHVYYRNKVKIFENNNYTYYGFSPNNSINTIHFGGILEMPSTYYYSSQEYAFFGISFWMPESLYLLMVDDIQEFQTILGRQV